MLSYTQIILSLYKILAEILWNKTPQALICRLDLKVMYHARCLDKQDFKNNPLFLIVWNLTLINIVKTTQWCCRHILEMFLPFTF